MFSSPFWSERQGCNFSSKVIQFPLPLSLAAPRWQCLYVRLIQYTLTTHFFRNTKHQNGGKCDHSYFVGATQAGIWETGALLWLSHTTVLRVYTVWCKKHANKKPYPVSRSSMGGTLLLMKELRGEWSDCSKLTGRLQ